MAFNRKTAVDFADKHWNTPADDGLFWLDNEAVVIDQVRKDNVIEGRPKWWKPAPKSDGWEPFFVNDTKGGEKAVFRRGADEILINPWEGLADCAHFLSRCLTAGGLEIKEKGVPQLIDTLQAKSNTKTLCEQASKEDAQRVIDSGVFKPGDMIGYFNVDPKGDYGGKKQYAHSGMYVGKIGGDKEGKITCHTICRFPGRSWVEDRWWLKPPGHYTYTLIHISDDDAGVPAAKAKDLSGWWKLDYSAQTEYYLVQSNGTAKYTKTAPKKGQTWISGALGSAYWFLAANGEITFIWHTGTVEVWKPDGKGYKSQTDGGTPGVLTKL